MYKKDKHEPREKRIYSHSNYIAYNKKWIATDDSGRVLGVNDNQDIVALADEVRKKYHHNDWDLHYVDISEVQGKK